MYPLLFLSFLSLTVIIERMWFWFGVLTKERETVNRVLDAARRDWTVAAEVSRQAYDQPIGRFLHTPLQLKTPDPDTFRLALEAAADEELASMRRGDKVLEAVIALAPLLGLLGTVIGLIIALWEINIGDIGGASTKGVTTGIGEALISTVSGLVVAVTSLAFYRLFQAFLFTQIKIFRRAGNELELLYRQDWAAQHPANGVTSDSSLPSPIEPRRDRAADKKAASPD
jgi:biopolymer transport protein ExbB